MPLWSNTNTNLSKPKYLKAGDRNNNNANVYGVNVGQQSLANTANYKFHGSHQGWVKVIPQYTDSSGQIRRKSETLIVISAVGQGGITGAANVALSGTGALTATSANVVGTNTRFTTEVKTGDVVLFGNVSAKVISVTNAAFLTVNAAFVFANAAYPMWVSDTPWFPAT